MRSLVLVVAVLALAWARPETYKETEDFQFSRSSSDEGTKSGYYGAQRGNTAGNYERAHNMDGLAQHQMSSAVHQIEGELGDAAKTRAGSVYTSANSRGVYGSGRYDLSNLAGRNFAEGTSGDSSHSSMSSAYNQHSQNSDWRSQSQRAGYGASSQLGQSSLHAGSLHAADDTSGYGTSDLGVGHSRSSGYHSASEYQSQSGYNSQNSYDQRQLSEHSGSYGAQAGDQSRRYTIVTPVRIVGRPGTQVAIPVYGQAYSTLRASSSSEQDSSNRQIYAQQSAASRFDQNAINSEAEVLNNNQQHISSVPVSDGKHYSSSYNYRKAWERRSETTDLPVPVAPTESSLPKQSELNEESLTDQQQIHSQNSHSGNAYNFANSYNQAHSAHSGSTHQADYRSQHRSQSEANSNAYTQGTYGSHSGLSSLVDSQPKSYQSSYSYHKSWEKQGDPYVIVPATNGEASQRLTYGNTKTSAASQRYGSHQHYSQGGAVDCDSVCRYRRATRSVGNQDYYQQDQEDLGQQAQTGWADNLGHQQQNRPAKLEDLGQQAQTSWGNLQDEGQQTQNHWDNIDQQRRPQKLEDLGQQTQQSWGNQEELGQQTQQLWGNIEQQQRPQKLEDLGQQTQQWSDNIQQHGRPRNLEGLGQQTQGKWQLDQQSESSLMDFGQQTQQSWDKSNIEQQSNGQNLEDFGQQIHGQWGTDNQQTQQTFKNFDNLSQQTQHKWDHLENLGQQAQQSWTGLSDTQQQNKPHQTEDLGQQTQNGWDNLDNLGQQVQNQWHNINTINKTRHTDTVNTEQQTQTHFESVDEIKPNRQHAVDDTQHTFNKENSYFKNPDNPAFWGLTDEQGHESNHYYSQHHSYYNHNSYSNSQSHGTSRGQEVNNINGQTTPKNPLQSLWDKLDNIEEQSEHSSNENQQHTEYKNSQHSYGQESTHHESSWGHRNGSHHHEIHNSGYQPPTVFNINDKPKNDQLHNEATTETSNDKDSHEEPEPAEVGRGDIGADESATTTKNIADIQTYTTHIKPDRTPEEIEALSLSRGTEEDNESLSVIKLSQQGLHEEQQQNATIDLHQISGSRRTTTPRNLINANITPKSNIHTFNNHENDKHSKNDHDFVNTNFPYDNNKKETKNKSEEPKEIQQENNAQQSGKTERNDYNLQQQNTVHELKETSKQNQDLNQKHLDSGNSGQHSHNFNLEKTGQPLEDFGQQSEHLSQQNLQHFTNLGLHSHNIEQQNTGQQLEDFGQQNQDLSQQNLHDFSNLGQNNVNFDQQNTGQQLEDFGQQSQDLNQQFTNLGQHSQNSDQQNTGQQLEDFGQQSQDLSQQNLQQFTNSEPHSQNFGQENTGQQLEDFGQQSQDLNQQNLQQFTNSEQHSQNIGQENVGQQLEYFGQQSQDLNQQNLQQFTNSEQHSQNIGKQNLYQHQGRDFVPDENSQIIKEDKITPVNVHGSENHPKQDVEIIPPSVTTEKPGFWKSVGSKLSSAKDSVASWFKRS